MIMNYATQIILYVISLTFININFIEGMKKSRIP